MDPRQALALLGPDSVNPDAISGGVPETLKADIAGALAGLRELDWHLIVFKWSQQVDLQDPLEKCTQRWLIGEGVSERWWLRSEIEQDGQFTLALAEMLIREAVGQQPCKRCNGTGFIDHRICSGRAGCDGCGRRRMTGRQRALFMGLPNSTWHDTWSARYEHLFRRISGIEFGALCHVGRQLKPIFDDEITVNGRPI